ncbi:MAG TPA: transcriptional regulator [Candidatus Blautia excrementigallinarum]|nr:transcriptional regulator [Candidatus Blautia excrementigallinarum]
MPRSFNQKLKILYLMKFLQEKTDREHPVSVKDIIRTMEAYGISVERKTVYDDIETLRTFGMKIGSRRGKPAGFYLEERTFELPELKFLMDAVQSSKFITEKQSAALVRKLEDLASVHEAKKLKSQVFLMPGIKTLNEEIYTNIETIYDAISANRQISFRYYQWTLSRELKPKRGGERYRVSPGKLLWNNDNYYLMGLDESSGIVKHYRVDKMMDVAVEEEKRSGESVFRDFDMGRFSAETFGMFDGKETILKIRFSNELVGVVLDRFGKKAVLQRSDDTHFFLQTHIRVSGQFFGWLTGLGPGAEIVSPEKVRKEYKSFLTKILKTYKS